MSEEIKKAEIIFYSSPTGNKYIEVQYIDETFWLSQKLMAELFGVETNTINYHLKEIFKSNELDEKSTIRKIRIVRTEGNRKVSRDVEYYNLDAFLEFNGYEILDNAGEISANVAQKLADENYEKFRLIQDKDFTSDFDKEVKLLTGGKK